MAPNMYNRIEVNLLPPEMRPRPAVRYTSLINAAVITLTLVFIVFNVYFNVMEIISGRQESQRLDVEIKRREPIRQDYLELKQIEDDLLNYGRIITMASADYVDLPVVLARLSALLPDGVYLSRVTNYGSRNAGAQVEISVVLRCAERNEQLLLETLTNLKNEPVTADCYMRSADLTEIQLTAVQDMFDVAWEVSQPESGDPAANQEYEFELLVRLDRVLPPDGLITVADESEFFRGFALNPLPPAEDSGTEVPGSRTPPASNAPAGVEVEGTN